MYRKVSDFLDAYEYLTDATTRIFEQLTDDNLEQAVAPGYRTLGDLAWHIVTTIPEMTNRAGLDLSAVDETSLPPDSAQKIRDGYATASAELVDAVKSQWTDGDLTKTDEMYGEEWPRGLTLSAVILHEVHHRGQMTVLLRQAGASVPGVYGPSKEEWEKMGMEPPAY